MVEDNEGSIDPVLGHEETTMFRAVAARLNNLSQDLPDITFATMKLCSKMSRPDAQDLKCMMERERVGFSLEGHELGVCLNGRFIQVLRTRLLTADWAGDRQSRKSVSGGMILHGKHLIKALATVQHQSRSEFRCWPKTYVEPSRFGNTSSPVRHCL